MHVHMCYLNVIRWKYTMGLDASAGQEEQQIDHAHHLMIGSSWAFRGARPTLSSWRTFYIEDIQGLDLITQELAPRR